MPHSSDNQIYLLLKKGLNLIKYILFGEIFETFLSLYKEIEQPINEDLQKFIDQYYDSYVYFGWKIFFSLDTVFRTLSIFWIFLTDCD